MDWVTWMGRRLGDGAGKVGLGGWIRDGLEWVGGMESGISAARYEVGQDRISWDEPKGVSFRTDAARHAVPRLRPFR